jgi:hypothetical protein
MKQDTRDSSWLIHSAHGLKVMPYNIIPMNASGAAKGGSDIFNSKQVDP